MGMAQGQEERLLFSMELGMDFLRKSFRQRLDWGQEWSFKRDAFFFFFPESKVMLFIGRWGQVGCGEQSGLSVTVLRDDSCNDKQGCMTPEARDALWRRRCPARYFTITLAKPAWYLAGSWSTITTSIIFWSQWPGSRAYTACGVVLHPVMDLCVPPQVGLPGELIATLTSSSLELPHPLLNLKSTRGCSIAVKVFPQIWQKWDWPS